MKSDDLWKIQVHDQFARTHLTHKETYKLVILSVKTATDILFDIKMNITENSPEMYSAKTSEMIAIDEGFNNVTFIWSKIVVKSS